MKVRVDYNVVRDTVDIYVEVAPQQALIYHPTQYRTDHVSPEAEWPVFLRLPVRLAEQIKVALNEGGIVLPDMSTRDAVLDARATRDRLLTLVEVMVTKHD